MRSSSHIFLRAVGLALGAATLFVGGAVFVSWLGIYNVAATSKHTPPLGWFLHFTMRNSVKAHARHSAVPPLADARLIAAGKTYAMLRCAPCHGAVGRPPDISATKLLPRPPPIAMLAHGFNANEVHWIIKHGVKMSAMPSWPTQKRDDDIWPLVAYLKDIEKKPGSISNGSKEGRSGLGAKVSIETCSACHGSDGNGRQGVFPKLAGLTTAYIESSLKAYRSGARPSGFMEPFAHGLSDADIKKFASSFGTRAREPNGEKVDEKRIEEGARIADPTKNMRGDIACMSCHTRTNPKAFADIPDLAGQPQWYLANQLKLFRARTRSGTPNSNIMARIAKDLSDKDIASLSAYFASLKSKGRNEITNGQQ